MRSLPQPPNRSYLPLPADAPGSLAERTARIAALRRLAASYRGLAACARAFELGDLLAMAAHSDELAQELEDALDGLDAPRLRTGQPLDAPWRRTERWSAG